MIKRPETPEEKLESARIISELADTAGWLEITKLIGFRIQKNETLKGMEVYDKDKFYAEGLGKIAKKKAYQDILNIVNQQKTIYNDYMDKRNKEKKELHNGNE